MTSTPSASPSHDRHRRTQRAIALSISLAISLTAVKVVIAIATGSVAVLSEAVHSLTDLVAAAVAMLALRRAAQPPDSRHRYGHDRLEDVSAIVEGIIILAAIGYVIVVAVQRLSSAHSIDTPFLAAAVMLASSVLNFGLARYLHRIGRETESSAVSADAQHLMTDVYTSGVTAIGLALVAITGIDRIDSIVALVGAALVVRIGVSLIIGSTRVLLDEGLPADEIAAIEQVIAGEGIDGVTGFHRLRTRRSGSRRYIDLHLTLHGSLTLAQAHELAHRVEHAIRQCLPNTDVMIHLEPDDAAPAEGQDLGPGDRL